MPTTEDEERSGTPSTDHKLSGAKDRGFIDWGWVLLIILICIIIAIGLTYIPPKEHGLLISIGQIVSFTQRKLVVRVH